MTAWLCAMAWLESQWQPQPWHAIAGLVLITFGYALPLGMQFTALRWLNRREPLVRPTAGTLLRAWLDEVWADAKLFYWQQPFRSNRWPDHLPDQNEKTARRGIIFIHGFICNRGFWNPWLAQLEHSGHACLALNLEPVFSSIDGYVPQLEEAVVRMKQATGMAPILVCHSMGGLVARAWMRAAKADDRIQHVFTIGSPHHGTWLGRFSLVINGWQMREVSPWLQQLEADEPMQRRAKFTCFYSNCDNIVAPALSGTLEGALNLHVAGAGHVVLGYEKQVMQAVFGSLDSEVRKT